MAIEKISIVLPTYNGSRYIKQAIESCLEQTYKNFELIIVDDCSTDQTPEIIKEFEDRRISYYRHKKNQGTPHALNTGFRHADGDYLTWISDDNIFDSEAIEKMLNFLHEKRLSFVFCDYYFFENDNISGRRLVRLPDFPAMERRSEVGPCFLYTQRVKRIVGEYCAELQLVDDYDYWIRVSRHFFMGHLNEPLYFYRAHAAASGISRRIESGINAALLRLKHKLVNADAAAESIMKVLAGSFWGYKEVNKAALDIFTTEGFSAVLKFFRPLLSGIYRVYKAFNLIIVKLSNMQRVREILNEYIGGKDNLENTRIALKILLDGGN